MMLLSIRIFNFRCKGHFLCNLRGVKALGHQDQDLLVFCDLCFLCSCVCHCESLLSFVQLHGHRVLCQHLFLFLFWPSSWVPRSPCHDGPSSFCPSCRLFLQDLVIWMISWDFCLVKQMSLLSLTF